MKTYFVTGASRGFGAEFVRQIIDRGDKVIAAGRSYESMSALKDQGAVLALFDVSAPLEELQKTAQDLIEKHGPIDVVIANAGYIHQGTLEESSPSDIQRQFDVNVFGLINGVKAFLPHLRSRRSGTIITMGSIGGWHSAPAVGVYCMSKYVVRGIAETLRAELSPFNIKVLHVEPGYFRTDFLTSDGARSVTIGSIADYDEMRKAADDALNAYNKKQPGDPVKGVSLVLDCITGTGKAEGKQVPWHICLGSDAYKAIIGAIDPFRKEMAEWKSITDSTDLDE